MEDFISGLKSKMSEVGNEISSRLENDIVFVSIEGSIEENVVKKV